MKGGQGIFTVLAHECREGLPRTRVAGFQFRKCLPITFGRRALRLIRGQRFENRQSFCFPLEYQAPNRPSIKLRDLLGHFFTDNIRVPRNLLAPSRRAAVLIASPWAV